MIVLPNYSIRMRSLNSSGQSDDRRNVLRGHDVQLDPAFVSSEKVLHVHLLEYPSPLALCYLYQRLKYTI